MKSKLTPGSVFCVSPRQGQGSQPKLSIGFFFSLAITVCETRIKIYLSSVLKKNFDDSLETTLNGSKFRFISFYCRSTDSFEKSPWVSTGVCFLQKRSQVLLLHNKPNMALKSCYSISQPISQPFLFTRGNKKIIQLLNSLNEVYIPFF